MDQRNAEPERSIQNQKRTAIYERVPTNELAIESMSMHETPKSQSFTSPWLLTRMFDGFMSKILQNRHK